MEISAPLRGNRRLEKLLAAANADERLRGWWHMQQVNAERLGMSDHSWVHVRIVLNIALRIFRLLERAGVEPAMVGTHGMRAHDAEVVIAAGCLFHDTGMSIHRTDHESFSLFLAADRLPLLLEEIYDEPERTVVHGGGPARRDRPPPPRRPVHDRGRRAEGGRRARHGVGPLARSVRDAPPQHPLALRGRHRRRAIEPGEDRAVRIEIAMNNSSGLFQVDELLATKLRGSGIEEHLEVVASIEAEHEKRLLPVFRV